MKDKWWLWIVVGLFAAAWAVLPDFVPGPCDDAIAAFVSLGTSIYGFFIAGKKVFAFIGKHKFGLIVGGSIVVVVGMWIYSAMA